MIGCNDVIILYREDETSASSSEEETTPNSKKGVAKDLDDDKRLATCTCIFSLFTCMPNILCMQNVLYNFLSCTCKYIYTCFYNVGALSFICISFG